MADTTQAGGDRESAAHDFDFIHGRWTVHNRRLRERGVGSDEWDEFPGEAEAGPLLGGAANWDEIRFPTKGFSGLTLRLYEPLAQRWSIYWINSTDGLIQPPVHGRFEGEVGEFFGTEVIDGVTTEVRFRWFKEGPDAARWEQAFSYDGGETWETNWTMELSRAEEV